MEILQNEITGIIAPKGSGKTHEVCQILKTLDRAVVFDIAHEEQYALACDDVVIGNPRLLAEILKEPTFKVSYRTAHLQHAFMQVCRLCYLRGDMTFIIEETDRVCSPHYVDEIFSHAINLGRHRQLSIVYVCRSFAGVSRDLTRNTNRFIFFKIIEPRDLDGIEDRCGSEIAARVRRLRRLQMRGGIQPGEKLIWTDGDDFEKEVQDNENQLEFNSRLIQPDPPKEPNEKRQNPFSFWNGDDERLCQDENSEVQRSVESEGSMGGDQGPEDPERV